MPTKSCPRSTKERSGRHKDDQGDMRRKPEPCPPGKDILSTILQHEGIRHKAIALLKHFIKKQWRRKEDGRSDSSSRSQTTPNLAMVVWITLNKVPWIEECGLQDHDVKHVLKRLGHGSQDLLHQIKKSVSGGRRASPGPESDVSRDGFGGGPEGRVPSVTLIASGHRPARRLPKSILRKPSHNDISTAAPSTRPGSSRASFSKTEYSGTQQSNSEYATDVSRSDADQSVMTRTPGPMSEPSEYDLTSGLSTTYDDRRQSRSHERKYDDRPRSRSRESTYDDGPHSGSRERIRPRIAPERSRNCQRPVTPECARQTRRVVEHSGRLVWRFGRLVKRQVLTEVGKHRARESERRHQESAERTYRDSCRWQHPVPQYAAQRRHYQPGYQHPYPPHNWQPGYGEYQGRDFVGHRGKSLASNDCESAYDQHLTLNSGMAGSEGTLMANGRGFVYEKSLLSKHTQLYTDIDIDIEQWVAQAATSVDSAGRSTVSEIIMAYGAVHPLDSRARWTSSVSVTSKGETAGWTNRGSRLNSVSVGQSVMSGVDTGNGNSIWGGRPSTRAASPR